MSNSDNVKFIRAKEQQLQHRKKQLQHSHSNIYNKVKHNNT